MLSDTRVPGALAHQAIVISAALPNQEPTVPPGSGGIVVAMSMGRSDGTRVSVRSAVWRGRRLIIDHAALQPDAADTLEISRDLLVRFFFHCEVFIMCFCVF